MTVFDNGAVVEVDDEDAAPVDIPEHPDNDPPPPTDFAPVEIPDHPDNDPADDRELAPVETFEDVPGGPEAPEREAELERLRQFVDQGVEVPPSDPVGALVDDHLDVPGQGDLSADRTEAEAQHVDELAETSREQVSHHMTGIPSPGEVEARPGDLGPEPPLATIDDDLEGGAGAGPADPEPPAGDDGSDTTTETGEGAAGAPEPTPEPEL